MRKFGARQVTVPITEERPEELRAPISPHKPNTEEQATAIFWWGAQAWRETPSVVDV